MPRPPARRSRPAPVDASDFHHHLAVKAGELAPADVVTLVAQAATVREHAARDASDHPLLASRVVLALDLLEDHAAGRCPQIPFHTVAVLAAAVFYYVDPLDVVPDVIPKVGTSDDGIVLELAFRLAAPGVERYRAWKGLAVAKRRAQPAVPPRRSGAKRSPSRRRRP